MVEVKGFIAAGLGGIAVVIIFLGLFTNEWVTAEEGSWELHIGLREYEFTDGANPETKDWSDEEGENDEDWNAAGLTAYIILWAALAVCVGAIACAILCGLNRMSKIPGMILGYVGGGLMMLAVMLYLSVAPKEYIIKDTGFGWTFYVVLMGGAMQAIGGDVVRGIKKASRKGHYDIRGRGVSTPPQRPAKAVLVRGIKKVSRKGHYDDRSRRDSPPPRRDDHNVDPTKRDYPPSRRDDYYYDRSGRDLPPPRRDDYNNHGGGHDFLPSRNDHMGDRWDRSSKSLGDVLTRLDGVDELVAKELKNLGYSTFNELDGINPNELKKIKGMTRERAKIIFLSLDKVLQEEDDLDDWADLREDNSDKKRGQKRPEKKSKEHTEKEKKRTEYNPTKDPKVKMFDEEIDTLKKNIEELKKKVEETIISLDNIEEKKEKKKSASKELIEEKREIEEDILVTMDCPKCGALVEFPKTTKSTLHIGCKECGAKGILRNPNVNEYLDIEDVDENIKETKSAIDDLDGKISDLERNINDNELKIKNLDEEILMKEEEKEEHIEEMR